MRSVQYALIILLIGVAVVVGGTYVSKAIAASFERTASQLTSR